MDFLRVIYNEVCCIIKSSFDISIQKVIQLFNSW